MTSLKLYCESAVNSESSVFRSVWSAALYRVLVLALFVLVHTVLLPSLAQASEGFTWSPGPDDRTSTPTGPTVPGPLPPLLTPVSFHAQSCQFMERRTQGGDGSAHAVTTSEHTLHWLERWLEQLGQ